uniref:Zinc finger protein 385A n=1 Tax=Salmo trutta TaxID=8032 RepID=A0A673YT66_SALTR
MWGSGSMNRPGAVPAFLRTPTVIPPPLDMKQFLQFPMDTAPPQHSMGLFHNFNTNSYPAMDPVQKAVMNHTFGPPMMKTKRPIISCNVCQIRFNSESQAEAHYKGNRHARRVKGIETSKTRPKEGDKPAAPPTASPSPPGPSPSSPDPDTSKQGDSQPHPHSNSSPMTPSPIPMSVPDTPDTPMQLPVCPLLPPLSTSMSTTATPSPADTSMAGPPDTASPAPSPSSGESEEDKAKKLLYCSLCKVAVNSLSQLEAHNKAYIQSKASGWSRWEAKSPPQPAQEAHRLCVFVDLLKGPSKNSGPWTVAQHPGCCCGDGSRCLLQSAGSAACPWSHFSPSELPPPPPPPTEHTTGHAPQPPTARPWAYAHHPWVNPLLPLLTVVGRGPIRKKHTVK